MQDARDWDRVKELEREQTRLKYRGMTPAQKLAIYEDMYQTALKLAPEKVQPPWPGDENWRKLPHLRNLIEMRQLLLKHTKK